MWRCLHFGFAIIFISILMRRVEYQQMEMEKRWEEKFEMMWRCLHFGCRPMPSRDNTALMIHPLVVIQPQSQTLPSVSKILPKSPTIGTQKRENRSLKWKWRCLHFGFQPMTSRDNTALMIHPLVGIQPHHKFYHLSVRKIRPRSPTIGTQKERRGWSILSKPNAMILPNKFSFAPGFCSWPMVKIPPFSS